MNGLFAGESMFHTKRDASKVALMALVQLMRDTGLQLLDVQWCTEHLASLGAIEVSRSTYLDLLATQPADHESDKTAETQRPQRVVFLVLSAA
jgi:leucyl/phenylalanyl-tRNA--protein transferase